VLAGSYLTKMIGPATLLCLAVSVLGYELKAGVTPVQKVIEMMKSMKSKAENEKDAEIKIHEEYQSWCSDTSVEKKQNIEWNSAAIGRLSADVQSNDAAAVALTDKVNGLQGDIATWGGDLEAANEIRATEKADYTETHTDYSESYDALERAIALLSKNLGSKKQAAMLLQTISTKSKAYAQTRNIYSALIAEAEEADGYVQPEAAGYTSSSDKIVEMLKDLREEFHGERSDLEKEEKEASHKHQMLALSLSDQIANAKKESAEKSAAANGHKAASAEAQGNLDKASAEKKEDTKYLEELLTQCSLKADSFATRQQMRGEEIVALGKAIEIIAGKGVSGSADKHLPALIQKKAVFMLRSSAMKAADRQYQAADFLLGRGHALKSQVLMQLASSMSEDPFAKVTQMIRDMIQKLQDEANAEADHKQWCDKELHDNKLTREEKTEQVNALTATCDQLNADIDRLSADQTELTEAMAALDQAMLEATENRQKEKAKNTETIADSAAAIEAVEMATSILKDFYGKAAKATALLQGPADEAPPSWDEPMTGNQGAAGGVMGMLEVIHTDFTRLNADTTSSEDQAAEEYDSFMATSNEDKQMKYDDRLAKSREQTAKEFDLGNTEKDLKATHGELDAAVAYFDKLKPDCIAEGLSFEERFQARQEEIESLNEAYKILAGEMDSD